MMATRIKLQGFSLIELMVVVVILGILATIVIPKYHQYVLRANRNEGIAVMDQLLHMEGRYFFSKKTYTLSLTTLGIDANAIQDGGLHTPEDRYVVSMQECTTDAGKKVPLAQCVEAIAAPQGTQAEDNYGNLNNAGVMTWNTRGEKSGFDH